MENTNKEDVVKEVASYIKCMAYVLGVKPKTCWDNYLPNNHPYKTFSWREINKHIKEIPDELIFKMTKEYMK